MHTIVAKHLHMAWIFTKTCSFVQDTLDASPDPQTSIDFFDGLADGTDAAAGATQRLPMPCAGLQ